MPLSKLISYQSLGYLFIALLCTIFIISAIAHETHDFANYFFGATFLRIDQFTSSIYFPHIFNLEIASLGYTNIFASYAPNTPFLALFFLPLTYVDIATSKVVLNIISLLLFIYSIRNLFKAYQISNIYLFILPLVFLIPLRNNFLFGQVYLLLFFLLAEGLLAYKKEAYIKMGVFWGISIMFKVFPIFLFGFLLFKKDFKAITYLGAACLLLFSVTLFINGIEVWEFYFSSVLTKSGSGEIASELEQNYQSMFMFIRYLFPSNETVFSTALLLFNLILLSLGYFITKYETSVIKVFAFWIVIGILVSPYGNTLIAILLVFPLISFIKNSTFNIKNITIIILFFLIANIPVHYFSSFLLPLSFPRLLLLLLLTFILIKNNFHHVQWKKSVLVIIMVLVLHFLLQKPKEDENNFHFLTDSNHILTYDYTVIDGILNYFYWNESGENIQSTGMKIKTIDTTNVSIINNQIFYSNKQFTFSNDNKLKPAIVNDSTLIYLTDLKRGIGFYRLRRFPLKSN
jgi:hypothetical protein